MTSKIGRKAQEAKAARIKLLKGRARRLVAKIDVIRNTLPPVRTAEELPPEPRKLVNSLDATLQELQKLDPTFPFKEPM